MGRCSRFHQHGLSQKSSLPRQWPESRACWDRPPTTPARCSSPEHLRPRRTAELGLTGTSLLPLSKEVATAPPPGAFQGFQRVCGPPETSRGKRRSLRVGLAVIWRLSVPAKQNTTGQASDNPQVPAVGGPGEKGWPRRAPLHPTAAAPSTGHSVHVFRQRREDTDANAAAAPLGRAGEPRSPRKW